MKKKVVLIVTFLIAGIYSCYPLDCRAEKIIAILPFENSSGLEKLEPLEEGLADLLIADLTEAEGITVVDRESLNRIAKEQKISLRGLVDKKTQIKVGNLVGANIMLTGGFSLVDSTMKINAHLLNLETTELIKSKEVKGKITDIVQLSRELTLKLLRDLEIKIETLRELDIDKSPEVNLHFIRGLGYYYGCMYDNAIMEFMNTMDLNSEHADARFWNAKSYFARKAWSHAKIELNRFLEEFPEDSHVKEVKKMNMTCWRNMKDWERQIFKTNKKEEKR